MWIHNSYNPLGLKLFLTLAPLCEVLTLTRHEVECGAVETKRAGEARAELSGIIIIIAPGSPVIYFLTQPGALSPAL